MLPAYLEECPICETDLKTQHSGAPLGFRDVFQISGMVIGWMLIPILLTVVLGIICVSIIR